ncbi:uncharacterized protein LOC129588016 [Paramacrobiotus metropolitanus]|uniref:uncharacterized protein LOC129588016 n=1 Tax=Paramacrobiotus metropolitanus TaxID=2943436 RepID=UPI0024462DC8|nr:uncharacterized protein LOC129588016 [Paramacrobiotus metropolitanus]
MQAKRVCALWQLLLSSPRMTDHISIHVDACWRLQADISNCFKLAVLLNRSINSSTISLTFSGAFLPAYGMFIGQLLEFMDIRLPLIVFKGQIICQPKSLAGQKEHRLKHPAIWVPTECKYGSLVFPR